MAATLPVLFRNTAGQLAADPAGFLCLDWSATPRTLADTQALLNHATLVLRQRGWGKVLGNQTAMLPFSAAEQQWVAQQWLPEAVQAGGYRYGAIVVSPDTYARLATAFITTSVGGLPLRYRSFDDATQATDWLLRVVQRRRGPGYLYELMAADSTVFFSNAAGRLNADPEGFVRAYWTTQPRTLADTQALFTSMSTALAQRG